MYEDPFFLFLELYFMFYFFKLCLDLLFYTLEYNFLIRSCCTAVDTPSGQDGRWGEPSV